MQILFLFKRLVKTTFYSGTIITCNDTVIFSHSQFQSPSTKAKPANLSSDFPANQSRNRKSAKDD